uniref:TOG domain-containing protein n=1 Tax=Aegilops tauschii subsp. strangulata TaxID=200361 RepID=A0A453GFN8_AEGTS
FTCQFESQSLYSRCSHPHPPHFKLRRRRKPFLHPSIHTPQRKPSPKSLLPPNLCVSIHQQASDPVPPMALRALDNTLPAAVADQRPKKAAKLLPTAPAVTRSPTGSGGNGKKQRNDENSAPQTKPASPVAAAAEPAVEYVRSEDLQPVPAPKARAAGLVAGLDSKDWVKVCEALNDARRLAIHHPALLAPILEKVVLGVVKTMKNPRSAVLKTSVMACTDVFAAFGNLISSASADAFDKLLLQLLLKASQDKRFVCEEAEKAMRAMATSMPPLPLLKKLRAYVHHANLRVRAKAAVAMAHCAARMVRTACRLKSSGTRSVCFVLLTHEIMCELAGRGDDEGVRAAGAAAGGRGAAERPAAGGARGRPQHRRLHARRLLLQGG